jgi:hypothetical protein
VSVFDAVMPSRQSRDALSTAGRSSERLVELPRPGRRRRDGGDEDVARVGGGKGSRALLLRRTCGWWDEIVDDLRVTRRHAPIL